ncbi:MAG: FAD-dependent oxidoreductase [Acidimicrobiales bacterium]
MCSPRSCAPSTPRALPEGASPGERAGRRGRRRHHRAGRGPRGAAAGLDVVVLESDDRAGGKVAGGPVEGASLPFDVDMAADGFLAREPEMTELCRELGLGDDLVSPVGAGAFLWIDGALRPIPPSVLGPRSIPARWRPPDSSTPPGSRPCGRLGGGSPGVGRRRDGRSGPASAGRRCRVRAAGGPPARRDQRRYGRRDEHPSRSAGAGRRRRPRRPVRRSLRAHVAAAAPGPVFHGVRGGSRRIVEALVARLGDTIRFGVSRTAMSVEPVPGGWLVETRSEPVRADRVVVTTPGWVTAGLLAPCSRGRGGIQRTGLRRRGPRDLRRRPGGCRPPPRRLGLPGAPRPGVC